MIKTKNIFQKSNIEPQDRKFHLVWKKIIFFIYVHIGALYGAYLIFTAAAGKTVIWTCFLVWISSHGIAVGTHRLWAHQTFKAKLPLKLILAFDQTLAFQKDIYDWVRDHRVHHLYSDTDRDPHNASRGFFYSHIGWVLCKKSSKVVEAGKKLDLSDLEADPVVMFQRKYYWYFAPTVAFLLPSLIPWYFWSETFSTSWYVCSIFRFCLSFNATCCVNSAAHIWGNKPYDKNIRPVETYFVAYVSMGEGFHNYHHIFPWDYKAAELGTYFGNLNTAFIDFMAKIGWAYDLKSVPIDLVAKRAKRTGDGSRKNNKHIWGWGDKNMHSEDIKITKILNK